MSHAQLRAPRLGDSREEVVGDGLLDGKEGPRVLDRVFLVFLTTMESILDDLPEVLGFQVRLDLDAPELVALAIEDRQSESLVVHDGRENSR